MKNFFISHLALILLTLNGNLVGMLDVNQTNKDNPAYPYSLPYAVDSGSFTESKNNSQEMIDCSESKDGFEFIALDTSSIGLSLVEHFDKYLHHAQVTRFSDGETEVTLKETDKDANFWLNKHAIIIQTTYPSPQEQIMHVAFLAHELKNTGCTKITAIIPYFGYSRQEKSRIPGKFGPAHVVAQLLQNAGIDQVVTIEAHTPVLKNFFTIPFHSLSPLDLITQHIREHIDLSHGVSLIAVDKGAYDRAHTIAQKLNSNTIYFTKNRYAQNKTAIMSMSGELSTPTAIIVDDMIDTGGTALQVCDALVERGAQHVFGYFVHPVLSNNALDRVQTSNFEKVFVANTIALKTVQSHGKVELFDISSILIEPVKEYVAD